MKKHNKPKIGDNVTYTEKGAGAYFLKNGCWPIGSTPECYGVLGKVISHAAMNIVTVKNDKGDTENFIWLFSDGPNDFFQWSGKNGVE